MASKNEVRTTTYKAKTTLHDDSAKQLKDILDVRFSFPRRGRAASFFFLARIGCGWEGRAPWSKSCACEGHASASGRDAEEAEGAQQVRAVRDPPAALGEWAIEGSRTLQVRDTPAAPQLPEEWCAAADPTFRRGHDAQLAIGACAGAKKEALPTDGLAKTT